MIKYLQRSRVRKARLWVINRRSLAKSNNHIRIRSRDGLFSRHKRQKATLRGLGLRRILRKQTPVNDIFTRVKPIQRVIPNWRDFDANAFSRSQCPVCGALIGDDDYITKIREEIPYRIQKKTQIKAIPISAANLALITKNDPALVRMWYLLGLVKHNKPYHLTHRMAHKVLHLLHHRVHGHMRPEDPHMHQEEKWLNLDVIHSEL